jgi:hypothetical protein
MAWRAIAVLGVLLGSESAATATLSPTSHLRPQTPRIEKWLEIARRSSPTVRALVDRIERSDVIVYLEIRYDLRPHLSAGLTWMAATESARLVRAALRPDLTTAAAVSMIAHELQHAVELVERPEVRSNAAMLDLYQRIGHPTAQNGKQWDTEAAIAAGTLARLEAIGKRGPAATVQAAPVSPGSDPGFVFRG